jgi:hypothetical protein
VYVVWASTNDGAFYPRMVVTTMSSIVVVTVEEEGFDEWKSTLIGFLRR